MATADVQVHVAVEDNASTSFLACACLIAIQTGLFDRFLPQLDSAIRHRLRTRRVPLAPGSVAAAVGEATLTRGQQP